MSFFVHGRLYALRWYSVEQVGWALVEERAVDGVYVGECIASLEGMICGAYVSISEGMICGAYMNPYPFGTEFLHSHLQPLCFGLVGDSRERVF